mgnify:CR=1 FL=1
MKYFNELDEMETQVNRLVELRKLYTVIINGALNGSTHDEIMSSIEYVEGSLSDISEKMSESFQELFDKIRKDEEKKVKK